MGYGGLGGLEGRVSGGLHKGVPRVRPLDSLMAVQGSLIPGTTDSKVGPSLS